MLAASALQPQYAQHQQQPNIDCYYCADDDGDAGDAGDAEIEIVVEWLLLPLQFRLQLLAMMIGWRAAIMRERESERARTCSKKY